MSVLSGMWWPAAAAVLGFVLACGGASAPPVAKPPAAPPAAVARATAGPDSAGAGGVPTALARVLVAIPDLSISNLSLATGVWKGFFAEEGLDVDLVQIGGQAAMPALLAGEVNYLFGWGAFSSGLIQGAPLKLVAVFQDRPPHALVAIPAIRALPDLRGRRLATSRPGGTDDQVVQRVLQMGGLRGDDVEMVRLGETSLRLAALLAGQVDATALVQPFTTEAERYGMHTLMRGGDVYQVPISIAGTSEAYLAAQPDAVRRFVRGVVRTLGYLSDARNVPEIEVFARDRYSIDGQALAEDMVAEVLRTVVASGEVSDAVLDGALASARMGVDRAADVSAATVADFSLLRAARREAGLP